MSDQHQRLLRLAVYLLSDPHQRGVVFRKTDIHSFYGRL